MSLAVVTTFFNPVGCKRRLRNFALFSRRIREQRVPLCVVECKHPDVAWTVSRDQADFCFRYECDDFLWQKERLFNLGVKRLSPEYDVVVLVDADIMFENCRWVESVNNLILDEGFRVVQPFEKSVHASKGAGVFPHPRLCWKEGFAKVFERHGFCSFFPNYSHFGHPGFAVAFDRNLIEEVGVYDRLITCSGDTILALATCGNSRSEDYYYSVAVGGVESYTDDIIQWRNSWRAALPEGRLAASVSGRVVHLWHGSLKNRKYKEKRTLYSKHNLTPDKILALPGEPLKFAPEVSEECRQDFFNYFMGQKADS